MTKFTPGPYNIHPCSMGVHQVVTMDDGHTFVHASIVIGVGDKVVGEVQLQSNDGLGYEHVDNMLEFKANAALFIAAPDLVEALRDVVLEPDNLAARGRAREMLIALGVEA